MTKFNYTFQKILDLKESEKEFAKNQMAYAVKLQEEGRKKVTAISNKILRAEEMKKEKQLNGVSVVELRMIDDYVNMLHDELHFSRQEVSQLEKQVVNTQKHLQDKTVEEKTWVNLKEKKQLLFQEKTKSEEQARLDELASSRYYYSTR